MARWFVVAFVALAIIQTTTMARNVPEDHASTAGLGDQKNFVFGSFPGNNGGDHPGSGGGVFGGFDTLPGFGGTFGGGDGTGIFPGLGGSPGSNGGGSFGSFPLP